jgi:steroid delta-isomerase-like uncharacterized protein
MRSVWIMAALMVPPHANPSAIYVRPAFQSVAPREVIARHLELMNRGDWKRAAEMFAPDVRHHLGTWREGSEGIVNGQQTLTENLQDIFRTFPDWKMEIVEMVAEGESVVVRCRVSGTHLGVGSKRVNGGFLVGVQPTGKRFEVQHIHWYRVRDGKITDHFANRDDLGMTQQLGILPQANR